MTVNEIWLLAICIVLSISTTLLSAWYLDVKRELEDVTDMYWEASDTVDVLSDLIVIGDPFNGLQIEETED